MIGQDGALEGLARAEDGQVADIEAFALAHYPRLIRLAGTVSHDVELAQDAVQAALERAWRKRDELTDPHRLRPWLDRIVVREAIRLSNRRRGLRGLLFGSSSIEWIDVAEHQPHRSDEASEATVRLDLRRAFATLSPGHRAVVALHLQAGYSVAETARALGVPDDTVRSRLRAARRRLRDEITEVRP